jgi:hypothetical protein
MSPFEFFFSFYGLLLALSVAVVASGLVKALKLHGRQTLGWLTPLMAVFILFDIASFWSWAWDGLREAPYSFGLLVVGMVIALTYFFAASFVFPEDSEAWETLDAHYDRRKRFVFAGVMVSNTLSYCAALAISHADPFSANYLLANVFYLALVISLAVCCFVRNRWVNGGLLIFNIVLYLYAAVMSFRLAAPA